MHRNDPPGETTQFDPLENALAAYLEQEASSPSATAALRERLLAARPELTEQLSEFFAAHDCARRAAAQWQSSDASCPGGDGVQGGEFFTPALTSTPLTAGGDSSLLTAESGGNQRRLGDYDLLETLGQGGMGIVFKARQRSLNRIVAVKMIRQRGFAHPQEQERFRLEAEAAARLRHPHIVMVHEFGQVDQLHFFSMELVEGANLAELVRRGPLPPTQAARYVQQVAEGVEAAHRQGVLHRDLKPSNVLIDGSDCARVMDFGLAKRLDLQQELTLSGQLVGTPTYMAPEQISRAAGEVGPATDVYGLGGLLYELLTGRPPFRGETEVETLLDALEGEPPPLRQINAAVPAPLEMIALRCLAKEPRRRYPSAAAVAEDLQRFLQGESLSVSSPNLLDRVLHALQRSRFDREVYLASRFVLHSAWIALATHAAVFLVAWRHAASPLSAVVGVRLAEVAAMGLAFWPWRREWFPPRGAAARQLWSLWLGYLVGSLGLLAVDALQQPAGAAYDAAGPYPAMAVLASLAFWILGSSYWGFCYLFAAAFLTAALAMPVCTLASPLLFGLLWGGCLVALGWRLRDLGTLVRT